MNIAIFADIHSNYLVFKKAYNKTLCQNIDKYIFLGDYITDGFDGNKIINLIKNSDCYAISGNREQSIIEYHTNKDKKWDKYKQFASMKYGYDNLSKENVDYISSLPIYKIIEIEGKKICISHSTPYSTRGDVFKDSYKIFDKLIEDFNCDIYLFGHEHKYYQTTYKNILFINPGSIGLPTDGVPYNYGILTIDNNGVKYKKMQIEYEYNKLHDYYTNSEYHQNATVWCELLLMVMQKGIDYPYLFLQYITKKAKELNIDISDHIPNELFESCFIDFKNSNK